MKFKVGDKVRITDNTTGHGFERGKEITISQVEDKYYRHGDWYFNDEDCKKINEEPIYEIY